MKIQNNYSEDIEPYDYKHNDMDLTDKPYKNFYRRLVEMYGTDSANRFYKEKVGEEPPKIEVKEESDFDLNNM